MVRYRVVFVHRAAVRVITAQFVSPARRSRGLGRCNNSCRRYLLACVRTSKAMAMKSPVLANLDGLLPELEAVYRDIHSHPELSLQEERTAGVAADHLRGGGYEVTTAVGKTGVVGLLRN